MHLITERGIQIKTITEDMSEHIKEQKTVEQAVWDIHGIILELVPIRMQWGRGYCYGVLYIETWMSFAEELDKSLFSLAQ